MAKLSLDLDNRTGKGFAEVARDLQQVGQQASATASLLGVLNAEFASSTPITAAEMLQELATQYESTAISAGVILLAQDEISQSFLGGTTVIATYATKIQELAGTIAEVSESTASLSSTYEELQGTTEGSSDANEQYGEGLRTVITTLGSLSGGVYSTQDALMSMADYVIRMADEGNESFQRLVDAGDKLVAKLAELAESEAAAAMINLLVDGIEALIPMIEKFAKDSVAAFNFARDAVNSFTRGLLGVAETLGIVSEGTSKTFDEIQRAEEQAQRKRSELFQKEQADRKQRREQEKAEIRAQQEQALLDPTAKIREEESRINHLEQLSQLDDEVQVQQLINNKLMERQKLLGDNAAQAKMLSQSAQALDNAEELEVMERRRLQLEKERFQLKKFTETQEDQPEIDSEHDADCCCSVTAIPQQQQQQPQQMPPPVAAPPQQPSGLETLGIREQIEAKPQLVARQIIKNREDAAVQLWERKRKKTRPRSKYEEHRVRTQARSQAVRELRRGNVGAEETQRAVSSLTNTTADMLKSQGGMNEASIEALNKLTYEANQRAEHSARMQDQLDRINDALKTLMSRGSNATGRAQR